MPFSLWIVNISLRQSYQTIWKITVNLHARVQTPKTTPSILNLRSVIRTFELQAETTGSQKIDSNVIARNAVRRVAGFNFAHDHVNYRCRLWRRQLRRTIANSPVVYVNQHRLDSFAVNFVANAERFARIMGFVAT